MIGGLIVFSISAFLVLRFIRIIHARFPFVDRKFLQNLFFYHFFLTLVYFIYIIFNPSDSKYYYLKVDTNLRGESWLDYYGTSTTFIEFIAYPFVKYFLFSFEATMVIFSTIGFLGFVYFYVFFRENLRFNHYFRGYNLLNLTFLLPNLHFWSSSLGKGAIIFFGLALFFYGLNKIQTRIFAIIFGAVIIYHVRPHVMLVTLVSAALGFMFSTRGVSMTWRIIFLFGAIVAFFYIYKDVLTLVKIDEEQFLTNGLDLSSRAFELSKAGSGVDISSYSLPMQLFTFLYRPLFFDAPGVLGIIVSFENLFYLILTIMFFSKWSSFNFLITSNSLVKTAFVTFFTTSIALAQVSGNLGLAMRQKSQVIILMLFVILSYLDSVKNDRAIALLKKRNAMTHKRDLFKRANV